MKKWHEMEKPAGVKEVPAPDEYYAIFGKTGGHENLHL